MSFDFDAAVQTPFRMQPGLRRKPAHQVQLTPMVAGSRHQREKLAVLSCHAEQALLAQTGFDARPALQAFFAHAQQAHPRAWRWQGQIASALALGTAVDEHGRVMQTAPGVFGLGDEIARCLELLPPAWRQVGLLCLTFEEDFALVDGSSGHIPWLAVALPSHWAPEDKVGHHFAAVHAPVADNDRLLQASQALVQLVCGPETWERFVWTITDQPRLHAHPLRTEPGRWQHTAVVDAWWRTEHQTFVPLPGLRQAMFTIHVQVQRLADVLQSASRARALHQAVASMSPAVLDYRGLTGVREPLLQWLEERARPAAPTTP
jgi:dimethylamine monooxygenase subunit A